MNKMSKTYRDKKKRKLNGTGQSVHHGRHVHALDNVIPLAQLRDELDDSIGGADV
jgi:hypothetical protein